MQSPKLQRALRISRTARLRWHSDSAKSALVSCRNFGAVGQTAHAEEDGLTPFQNLDWDDLRIFLAVTRHGSLSGAAKHLKVDHSTVSRRISQLEYEVGGSLFERHHAGLRLNELGGVVQKHAESVEGSIIRLREEVAGPRGGQGGTVRVAMMEGIASLYLSRRLGLLRESHPQIDLELVTSAQHVQVSRREADIFLSFFKAPGRGIQSERIGEFGLGLFAAPSYLDKRGTPESLDELSGHNFVSYIDDLLQLDAVRWLDEVIREPRLTMTSNSMIAQMVAAAGGLGLVLLPYFAVENEPKLVRVLDGQVRVQREVWMNLHQDLQYVPRVRAVAEFLKALLAADAAYLAGTALPSY